MVERNKTYRTRPKRPSRKQRRIQFRRKRTGFACGSTHHGLPYPTQDAPHSSQQRYDFAAKLSKKSERDKNSPIPSINQEPKLIPSKIPEGPNSDLDASLTSTISGRVQCFFAPSDNSSSSTLDDSPWLFSVFMNMTGAPLLFSTPHYHSVHQGECKTTMVNNTISKRNYKRNETSVDN